MKGEYCVTGENAVEIAKKVGTRFFLLGLSLYELRMNRYIVSGNPSGTFLHVHLVPALSLVQNQQVIPLGKPQVNTCVNVRSLPSEEGEVLGKLYNNSVGTFISEENGWYQITSGLSSRSTPPLGSTAPLPLAPAVMPSRLLPWLKSRSTPPLGSSVPLACNKLQINIKYFS